MINVLGQRRKGKREVKRKEEQKWKAFYFSGLDLLVWVLRLKQENALTIAVSQEDRGSNCPFLFLILSRISLLSLYCGI
jgi:hypothetical protein